MATFLTSTAHISVAFYSILVKFSVLLLFLKALSEYVIQIKNIRKKVFVTSHFGTPFFVFSFVLRRITLYYTLAITLCFTTLMVCFFHIHLKTTPIALNFIDIYFPKILT